MGNCIQCYAEKQLAELKKFEESCDSRADYSFLSGYATGSLQVIARERKARACSKHRVSAVRAKRSAHV